MLTVRSDAPFDNSPPNYYNSREGVNLFMQEKHKKTIMKVCELCKGEFLVSKCHTYQKYCSWGCRNRMFILLNPEKVKESKRKEKIKHAERYRLINGEYKNKIRFGGNRRKVMERDRFACLMCSREYPSVNLIVHHIDRNKSNNTLSNLQTLCRSCHLNEHRSEMNGQAYAS